MCQTGTTSDRACSYVSSSPGNGGPDCLKFCWESCQKSLQSLKESGDCSSVINNFFFSVCVRTVLVKRYFSTWYVLIIYIKG